MANYQSPELFSFITKPNRPCTIETLMRMGMPMNTVLGVRDKTDNYCKRSFEWLRENWSNNMALMNFLGDFIQKGIDTKGSVGVPIRNNAYTARARAVMRLLQEDGAQIYHVYCTLGKGQMGTLPQHSTMFNNMSFAERQKHVQAMYARLEEVPKDERK